MKTKFIETPLNKISVILAINTGLQIEKFNIPTIHLNVEVNKSQCPILGGKKSINQDL